MKIIGRPYFNHYTLKYEAEVKEIEEMENGKCENLRLSLMQTGIIILGKILCDKLQVTPKGDKYVVLFGSDCEELIKDALEKARQEVE